jgi:choline dehydrogenase-like flavoprotein
MVQYVNPLFAGVSLRNSISSYASILKDAQSRPAVSSLPCNTDRTVLAGYQAQRKLIIQQLNNSNVATSILSWDTFSSASIFHMKPLSRGTVTVNSTDPLANPVIDYRTGTDPTDLAINVAMLHKLRTLMAAPSMQALGPVELAPFGATVQSDADILAVARNTLSISNAHQCCTAPMMPRALGGVVDSNHKVYGVTRLRTADVSYMPFSLSGAPTAAMYASAEKVSPVHFRRETPG